MCGIAGLFRAGGSDGSLLSAIVGRMARTLVHHVPDTRNSRLLIGGSGLVVDVKAKLDRGTKPARIELLRL
jgi:hypothetical protein